MRYLGTYWYHSHLSTQYCDGLRGPLVVYDPHDPQAHLYDVDNGENGRSYAPTSAYKSCRYECPDQTVITLADWYHVAARLGSKFPYVLPVATSRAVPFAHRTARPGLPIRR